MKRAAKFQGFMLIMLVAAGGCFTSCSGQKAFGTRYLKLEKIIPLPGVKGRIDHMDINLKEQVVYIAALGNNTLEVVDLHQGKLIHSIKGLDEPQGIGYIPQNNEIFAANGGNGDCYFYNARSFEKTATIHLSSDADDVRYDSTDRKIYVGYGEGDIAMIDADSHRQIGEVKLPVHPESFQIDEQAKTLFVNLPDANMIGVVDMKQLSLVKQWKRSVPLANFPMALDAMHHRLFIGYRLPAKLLVLDSGTGKMIGTNTMTNDADDLYYDEATGRIYVSGGGGSISIFGQQDGGAYHEIANIPTRGGARTSLFVPKLQLFLLAERATGGKDAQLLVYKAVP